MCKAESIAVIVREILKSFLTPSCGGSSASNCWRSVVVSKSPSHVSTAGAKRASSGGALPVPGALDSGTTVRATADDHRVKWRRRARAPLAGAALLERVEDVASGLAMLWHLGAYVRLRLVWLLDSVSVEEAERMLIARKTGWTRRQVHLLIELLLDDPRVRRNVQPAAPAATTAGAEHQEEQHAVPHGPARPRRILDQEED